MDFGELFREAEETHGEGFRESYARKLAFLSEQVKEGSINILECNFALLEVVFDHIEDLSPRVVYGLIPPYYPNVSNLILKEKINPGAFGKAGRVCLGRVRTALFKGIFLYGNIRSQLHEHKRRR